MDRWSTDAKVKHLVSMLHSGSWMRYGSSEEVVVTRGRQGCKLGGVVFGSVYAQGTEHSLQTYVRCQLVLYS